MASFDGYRLLGSYDLVCSLFLSLTSRVELAFLGILTGVDGDIMSLPDAKRRPFLCVCSRSSLRHDAVLGLYTCWAVPTMRQSTFVR